MKKKILSILMATSLLLSPSLSDAANIKELDNSINYFAPYGSANIYGRGEAKGYLLPVGESLDLDLLIKEGSNILDLEKIDPNSVKVTSDFNPNKYGDQLVEISFKDKEGFSHTSYLIITTIIDKDNVTNAEEYVPKINNVKAFKDSDIRPEDFVSNLDKLPEDSKVSFPKLIDKDGKDLKIDTSKVGNFELVVRITYPDESFEDFKRALYIEDGITDIEKVEEFFSLRGSDVVTGKDVEEIKKEREEVKLPSGKKTNDAYVFSTKNLKIKKGEMPDVRDFFNDKEEIPTDYEISFKDVPDVDTIGEGRVSAIAVKKDKDGNILDSQNFDLFYEVEGEKESITDSPMWGILVYSFVGLVIISLIGGGVYMYIKSKADEEELLEVDGNDDEGIYL